MDSCALTCLKSYMESFPYPINPKFVVIHYLCLILALQVTSGVYG